MHHARGVCKNQLLLDRETIEREILAGLERGVMRPEAVRLSVEEFGRQLRERVKAAQSNMAAFRQKRDRLRKKTANLAEAIGRLGPQPDLLNELAAAQRELDSDDEEMFGKGKSIDSYLAEIEALIQRRIVALRGILRSDVGRAKSELSKHCTKFEIKPAGKPYSYIVTGDWELLGGQRVRTVGGGGQKPTQNISVIKCGWVVKKAA
jgi:hypothetical protein